MERIVGIKPSSTWGAPTTRDDVRAILYRPKKGVGFRLGSQLRYHPDRHEFGSRSDAGGSESAIAASHACTCRTMLLSARVRTGISVVRRGIPRGNNLAVAGELLMIDVDTRIDDGDRDPFALGNGVSCLDVRACADRLTTDGCRLEVPLLWNDCSSTQTPDQL